LPAWAAWCFPTRASSRNSLENGKLETKYICRTFSDCTTAPRNGIKSGCFPLDEYYRNSEAGEAVRKLKKEQKEALKSVQEASKAAVVKRQVYLPTAGGV